MSYNSQGKFEMHRKSKLKYDIKEETSLSKRLRVSRIRGKMLVEKGLLSSEEYEKNLNKILIEEAERRRILDILKKENSTVSKISKVLTIDPQMVVAHLIALMKNKKVAIVDETDEEYVYQFIK